MKQALVFRLDNNDTLIPEVEDNDLMFYYVDILKEEDIIFYLYNNDLNFFLDKYVLIKNNKYLLKSISLNFSYFIEIRKDILNNYLLTEINSPLQIHDEFFEKYNFKEDERISELLFSYEEDYSFDNINIVMVKDDIDLLNKIFYINKKFLHYFIYKDKKIYMKSLLYKNDIEKEVDTIFIPDLYQFIHNNFN